MIAEKNKNNLYFLLSAVFLFIFSIYLVGAQDQLVYKVNEQANLIKFCFNNGTFCSSSTFCNSTIIDPVGNTIINNSRETNQGSFFNLSIREGLVDDLGTYTVIRTCTDTGGQLVGSDYEIYNFLVTPSGTDDNSLGQLFLVGLGLIFSVGLIYIGFYKEDPAFVLFGSITLFLFGLFTLLNGIGNYRNSLTEGTSLIVLSLAGYVSIRTGIEMLEGF
jgi:hypothetical protein